MKRRTTLGTTLLTLALASCGGPSAPATAVPSTPTTFTATAATPRSVDLKWNTAAGAAGYRLERKTNGGTYASLAANLPANTLSYTDTNLTPETAYTYRLQAVNAAGTSGGVEREVTTLAQGAADFTLGVQPGSLTLQSGRSGTVAVTVTRPENGGGGNVTLTLEGAIVGEGAGRIAGTFGAQTNGTSALTLTVGRDVPVGLHTLTVRGRDGGTEKTATLQINVERWLLVDDDRSGNNWPASDPNTPDSPSDRLMRAALQEADKSFDVAVVTYSASGKESDEPDGPSAAHLTRYSGVVWYTGARIESVVTFDDLRNLAAFLDQPQRQVVLVSPGLLRDAVGGRPAAQQPDAAFRSFLQAYAGAEQVAYPGTSGAAYTLTGQAGTVLAGLNLTVGASNRAFLTPGSGTQALLKDGANVLMTRKTNVGAAGTSRMVLGAFASGSVTQPELNALVGRLLNP